MRHPDKSGYHVAKPMRMVFITLAACALSAAAFAQTQRTDEGYTAKIHQYTTEPYFLTELVDHLPASDSVPTPEKILGYAIGTPDKLTYTKDIYRYMRALEAASKRVKIFSIGK